MYEKAHPEFGNRSALSDLNMFKRKTLSTLKGVEQKYDQGILKQVSIWSVLASVLPLSTISFIGFCYLTGFDHWIEIVATLSLTGLIFVAAIWWWWGLTTIVKITKIMNTAYEQFEEIRQDIRSVKQDISKVKRSSRK